MVLDDEKEQRSEFAVENVRELLDRLFGYLQVGY
jgi:hypothetical protein